MIIPLLKTLKESLKSVPDLRMIDFDRGQLNKPEDYESVLQPAVLVGIPVIDWKDIARSHQDGDGTFYTKTVVRLPQNNAYYTSPEFLQFDDLTEENLNELLIEDAIHQEIIKLDSVVRVRTQQYPFRTFFVTEHTYTYSLRYSLEPRYRPHLPANKPGINVILEKP
jgi:hypothetical protein